MVSVSLRIVINVPVRWGMLRVGETVCEGGGRWETSVPSPQFCSEPKTSLKVQVY